MRIVSGRYKGLGLAYPKNRDFRPTQEKVRAAILNSLGARVQGAWFLDLCCGTGAMGIEALSRGAAGVVLVDTDVTFAKQNVAKVLAFDPELDVSCIQVIRGDVLRVLTRLDRPFGAVFSDPPWPIATPFYDHLFGPSLLGVLANDILAPEGVLVCEHPKSLSFSPPDSVFESSKTTRYGDTMVSMFHRKPSR